MSDNAVRLAIGNSDTHLLKVYQTHPKIEKYMLTLFNRFNDEKYSGVIVDDLETICAQLPILAIRIAHGFVNRGAGINHSDVYVYLEDTFSENSDPKDHHISIIITSSQFGHLARLEIRPSNLISHDIAWGDYYETHPEIRGTGLLEYVDDTWRDNETHEVIDWTNVANGVKYNRFHAYVFAKLLAAFSAALSPDIPCIKTKGRQCITLTTSSGKGDISFVRRRQSDRNYENWNFCYEARSMNWYERLWRCKTKLRRFINDVSPYSVTIHSSNFEDSLVARQQPIWHIEKH